MQVLGSLLAAAIIVILVAIVVTNAIGPGVDSKEQRDQRDDQEQVDGDGGRGPG